MSDRPRWTECDHNCDPQMTGARRDGAWHYSDCPVWEYLGVSLPPTEPQP